MLKNWAEEAAMQIVEAGKWSSVGVIQRIIISCSPFKEDVVYMPVPRCDSCKHWDKSGHDEEGDGSCLLMFEHGTTKIWPDYRDGINTKADFGCVQWEKR